MNSETREKTFAADAGIAIGPILFVIALLAILAAVIASGNSDFGTASIADRVSADIASQANLIRTKINECNIKYGTNNNGDGFPDSGGNAVQVSTLNCAGDPSGTQNIWTGMRATLLPPPTTGFGQWYYINTNPDGMSGSADNGRCIYIAPTISNPKGSQGIVAGLQKAASKFSNSNSFNNTTEVIYDPTSTSQKFVLWITMPTASGTPDSHCLP